MEITSVLGPNHVIIGDRGIPGGPLVFRGTRVRFQALVGRLEGGQTLNEFLDDFPTVTGQAAVHALEHARALVVSELG